MGWQEKVALSIVGLTAVAFLVRSLRQRRPGKGTLPCAGCAAGRDPAREPRLVLEGRKGEKPRLKVTFKS